MSRLRRLRLTAALGAVGLAAAVALAGCGSGMGGDSAQSQSDTVAPAGEQQRDAGDAGDATDLRVGQRTIIYTGSITVRVSDVDQAAASAISIVTAAGGFVGGDTRTRRDSASRASLEMRVPADKFTRVVNDFAGLGEQERRDLSTRDVTEETLDLEARIITQRARVDSGRRLLAQAETLDELVMLERELAQREADLASLEAKKRHLDDLVALSTITVVLLGPNASTSETGFLTGLEGGWKAFVVSMKVLLTVLGALLPWLIAIGVPVYGVIWLIRRMNRRAAARSVPPPTFSAPSAPPAPLAPPAPPAPPMMSTPAGSATPASTPVKPRTPEADE